VWPNQIVDFLALTGDKSDNIPGVQKCGPKTAAKWLNQWQNLDSVMTNAGEVKGKIGGYLNEALPILPLSRELATIRTDLELDYNADGLKRKPVDEEALRTFLQHNEFNSWLQELGDWQASPGAAPEVSYVTVLEQGLFEQWLARLQDAELIALDTETTGLDSMQAELVGLSFAVNEFEAIYIPLAHDYAGAPVQLDRDKVLQELRPVLEAELPRKVGQHIKYDMNILSRYGQVVNGVAYDTMLESYVFNSTGSRHDMDSLDLK